LRLAAFVTCLILACSHGAACAAALQRIDDFQAAAREATTKRLPLLVAFTRKSCPHCAVARREYLEPMQADPAWRGRVLMVEIDLDASGEARDFDGSRMNRRDLARRHHVRAVPTVVVFDDRGQALASPLVGLAGGDFYRLYLEQLAQAGIVHMRRTRR